MFQQLFSRSELPNESTTPTFSNPLMLHTDQYQLSMAYAYWKQGMAEQESNFQLFFRKNPFGGSFVVSAGLDSAIEYLLNFSFDKKQLDFLGQITDKNGAVLYDQDFLHYLATLQFSCDIDAIPEGSIVFPNEPLLQVRGPILQAQIIETTLLNLINFQSLVATKAARIRVVAGEDSLFEFGLRRAQGLAALSVARASYIGGFDGTSNLLAGQLLGIPTVGTHAHSWVMAHDSEQAAFEAFAAAMPNNCVFLVDTYNTSNGIDTAITVGKQLRARGQDLLGVRLDSGDLAYFSKIARKKLDEAGFKNTKIMASNELDEHVIESLKVSQGAEINAWGVGTKLATCYDDAALSGVYKLSAISKNGRWIDKMKLSEQRAKMTIPGIQSVYRYYDDDGAFIADAIAGHKEYPEEINMIVDPHDDLRTKAITSSRFESLLEPLFKQGKLIAERDSLTAIKARAARSLQSLDISHKRLAFPHTYPVGLSTALNQHRDDLMQIANNKYKRN